jgi:hypothetical protein
VKLIVPVTALSPFITQTALTPAAIALNRLNLVCTTRVPANCVVMMSVVCTTETGTDLSPKTETALNHLFEQSKCVDSIFTIDKRSLTVYNGH